MTVWYNIIHRNMTDQKFNPIADANLPPLPGQDVTYDAVKENTQTAPTDATSEPIASTPKIQKEIIFQTEEPKVVENNDQRKAFLQKVAIFFILLVIIIGIILIVQTLPKLINSTQSIISKNSTTTSATTQNTSAKTASTTLSQTAIPQVTTTTKTQYPSTNLKSDLAVKIFAVNNVGGRVDVHFNVENIGGSTSGPWTFSATLPSTVTPIYYSEVQTALSSKSGVVYTLGFSPTPGQNNLISIKIFPPKSETNDSNNVAMYLLY